MTADHWHDPEAPAGDAAEQSLPADPDETPDEVTDELPPEAAEADALDQKHTVPTPEEDYRR